MHVQICMRRSIDVYKHPALTGLLRLVEGGVPHGRRFIHLRSYWLLAAASCVYFCFHSPSLLHHFFLPSCPASSDHSHAPQARLQTYLQTSRRPFESVTLKHAFCPLMLTAATGARLFSTTIPKRADVTLTIDGKEVTVPAGTALIQACEKACVYESL